MKRFEARVGTMIEFLEHLRESKHPLKEEKKELKPYQPKLQQYHTHDIKAYVVYLRHKSLTDDSSVWHTYRETSQLAGVKLASCMSIVARWKVNGFRIINRRLG